MTTAKSPKKMDSEALAAHVQAGMLKVFSELRPFIEELWKRFDALKAGETIAGCKNRKEYCEKVLHRTPRAVRYMLNGGNPNNVKVGEIISAPGPAKERPLKEYESLIEALPTVRIGGEEIPPSKYGAAEIEESVAAFTSNLVGQLKSPADRKIVYRSLIRKFESLLQGLS